MGQRWIDADVRVTHRALIVTGVLLGGAGVVLDVLSPSAGSVGFGAAAHTGYVLTVLLIGGTLGHRWWYFGPTRVFRRELGGPDGWLDRHDLARTAGADGIRCAVPAQPVPGTGPSVPVTAYGWQVGQLVSGGPWVRLPGGPARGGRGWRWRTGAHGRGRCTRRGRADSAWSARRAAARPSSWSTSSSTAPAPPSFPRRNRSWWC